MNVIIEGCDNAGKSSLIKHLVSRIELSTYHNVVDKNAASTLAKQAAEISRDGNTIYDRSSVISEYIYSMVLGRAPVVPFNISDISELCDNAIVVFCMPPIDKVLATTKEEMQGVRENLFELYNAYDKLIDSLALINSRFFIYDWTVDSPEAVLDYISETHLKWWKN